MASNLGPRVEFVAENGKVHLRPKEQAKNPVDDRLQTATSAAKGGTTTAKLMKLTRGDE